MAKDINMKEDVYDPKKDLDTYDYDYDHNAFQSRFFLFLSSLLTRITLFSAGVDKQLLAKCPYSERVKYIGLGGIVLATTLLAFFSGSYAFFTVFGPKIANVLDATQQNLTFYNNFTFFKAAVLSCLCGLVWALVIFNLDRFIVTSTGHGDGTEKITSHEFINGIPRILLATVVAMCLAKPLELRIFKTELDEAVSEAQQTKLITLKKSADDKFKETQKFYEDKIKELESDKKLKESKIQEYEDRLANERAGVSGGTTGFRGEGRTYIGLKEQLEKLKENSRPDIDKDKTTIEQYQFKLLDAKKEYENEVKIAEKKAFSADGLALRIKLAGEHFPTESLWLTLMLIFIEITPVFIKMQFIRGPYDYLNENQKKIVMAKYGIEERLQTVPGKDGKPTQDAMPIYHLAENITEYETGKLNVEKNLVKTAHKTFQDKVTNQIIYNPKKFMPDLKTKPRNKKTSKK